MAIIEALADGSLYTTSTARAEALVVSPTTPRSSEVCGSEAVHPRELQLLPREVRHGARDTLPPFPFEPGSRPSEAVDAETALQIIYELENPE